MIGETDINKINLYLIKIKKLLSSGKYDFVPRKKNLDSLSTLGFTIDYDKDKIGKIWVFKKKLEGYKFYIKLKIVSEDNNDILRYISFHKDKYKEGEDEIL